ncbi:MAG: biotin synthase BioB [Candidatus Omnitrophota bacterium]
MKKELINSFLKLPLSELISIADKVRREFAGTNLDLCSILNAKSGLCGQDCKFCAQALRHKTKIPVYPLKTKKEIFDAARRAKDIGAERFDIVTSGDSLSKEELKVICEVITEITKELGIKMCASLGAMGEEALKELKQSGLTQYHHNIETSAGYFPKIVTTHTFQDRVNTIKAAKNAGLRVCSGGIIGLGETMEDRVEMALCLQELNVDSVPLNILVPVKGTPLEGKPPITCEEVIRTIAIFRIILKDKVIKIAAGRESLLKDFQALGFMAGANGMLIGGYLTIKGRSVEEDWRLAEEIKKIWQI